ncbi:MULTISPECIES: TIGR02221 family CRISPR-associated protein [Anaerolinea]|uniref:TIGR02221 family CRISPR-associated protein n=1 Tax=Anaerolinea TaxID=233189 RepID=UPI0026053FEC|nr:TIGR02221 family CRISPR-associated protein [Anaerolinea thermophila]
MTHTVITFMSATPRETTYQFAYDPETYSGMIFGEALLSRRRKEKMPFDRLLLCVTDSLYEELEKFNKGQIDDENRLPYLEKVKKILNDLENEPDVEILKIKTGRNTNEVWDIFNTVTERIEKEEQVSFDITHGLRSIPFMVFLFAAFLKSAKDVEIKAILYGAADLTDKTTNVAPVIDLTPFVEMLDWINATEFFVKTGNAEPMAHLLEKRGERKQNEAARVLRDISKAASLCQPFSLAEKAARLDQSLKKAAESFSHTSKPFSILANRIVEVYQPFVLPKSINKDQILSDKDALDFLKQEWHLIEWYRKNGQILQAFTLAREYAVDLVMWRIRKSIHFDLKKREETSQTITEIAKLSQKDSQISLGLQWLQQNENEAKEVSQFLNEIFQTRNDLAHAGHKSSGMSLSTLEKKEALLDKLAQQCECWGIPSPVEVPPSDAGTHPD